MRVDSNLCTVARLLKGIQERANQSFVLEMYTLNSNSLALETTRSLTEA